MPRFARSVSEGQAEGRGEGRDQQKRELYFVFLHFMPGLVGFYGTKNTMKFLPCRGLVCSRTMALG